MHCWSGRERAMLQVRLYVPFAGAPSCLLVWDC